MSYYSEYSDDGTVIYGAHAYIKSLSIIPCALVVAGVILSLLVLTIRIKSRSVKIAAEAELAK